MKKIILFLILSVSTFAQINVAKLLTPADSVYDVICLSEWLEIAVLDTTAADSITVWYPYTDSWVDTTIRYASIGMVKEMSSGNYVNGLYGSADMKYYILWLPSPRAVRFLLSDYASGHVEIKATSKP